MWKTLLASILLVGWGCARPPAVEVEGMCTEHGVLEAVCPKCNPALAAVFQVKGDWCAEHGFPESFCPICHPERGGRPVLDVSAIPDDGAPAHGTKVRFKTRETARLAGIQTVAVVEVHREETIPAVARVVYDGAKRALVSAPAGGIVSEIRVDVGATVRRGAPLAVIRSAAVGAERSLEVAARSRLAVAEQSLDRLRGISDPRGTSLREVQEAEQIHVAAKADLAAIEARLGMVGGGRADTYTLVAPLGGEIIRRDLTVGMAVEGGAPLYEIVDASTMWAELDVRESDLPHVSVGAAMSLVLDPYPDRVFEGALTYIAPAVSAETRTALARVPLDNADRALRSNMYGTGHIGVTGAPPAVTVPAAAVQNARGISLVFVRIAEDEFEARRVQVRSRRGGDVYLSGGVTPGEIVVTTGSFLLKTETLKDSIGAGCCDVE